MGGFFVQGGHVLAFGAERDHSGARKRVSDIRVEIETGLARNHQHGTLGGVADHTWSAITRDECGVVAGRARKQTPTQRLAVDHRLGLAGAVEDGSVGGVARAGHVEPVVRRPYRADGHLVFGERAGLVRTDHGRAAQGLHRRQPPDHRPSAGHARHTDGQGDGDRSWESLGDGPHGQRHRCGEHLHRPGPGPRRSRRSPLPEQG